MATLSVRIPSSMHSAVKALASADDISINQFVNSAIAEKVAALETENYIKLRGELGDKNEFLQVLDKIPD